jgi:hypothetical protein
VFTFSPAATRSIVLLGAAAGAVKGAVVGVLIGKLAVGIAAGACGGALFGTVTVACLRRNAAARSVAP